MDLLADGDQMRVLKAIFETGAATSGTIYDEYAQQECIRQNKSSESPETEDTRKSSRK